MEDEMDIQPPDESHTEGQGEEKGNPLTKNKQHTPPSAVDLPANLSYDQTEMVPVCDATSKEAAVSYAQCLHKIPELSVRTPDADKQITPVFEAPYLNNNDSGIVTYDQLVTGIFINVPRSPKLWAGDQLKMRWGYNTYYTTITEPTSRTGPRLTQYLNSERLGDYPEGVVEVRYEVVRRARLIGVSETLKLTLSSEGKPRPKPPSRGRAIRRRKLP